MTAQKHDLRPKKVPLRDLVPYPDNPRRGNVEELARSLEVHGQYRPLVVQASTNYVLAGNHTLAAAIELGWKELSVTRLEVDDEQAKRIVLVDNRTSDLAGHNNDELARLLDSLSGTELGLEGTGFDDEALTDLLADLSQVEPGEGGDTEPGGLNKKAKSSVGEIWTLGTHRLIIGDATRADVWEALAGETKADLLVTDPPYGISYVGKTSDALKIENDAGGSDEMADLWQGSLTLAAAQLKPGAAFYIAGPPGALIRDLMNATVEAGLDFRQQIIWRKDAFVLGRSDYHYQHETLLFGGVPADEADDRPELPRLDGVAVEHDLVLYGWTEGPHLFRGGRKQTSVWDIARPKANREHPTMKPVLLYERAIANSTIPGAVVLEPFAGSGTAFIAAENMGRRCLGLELDPIYADVIIDRWERHTGEKAVLDGTV